MRGKDNDRAVLYILLYAILFLGMVFFGRGLLFAASDQIWLATGQSEAVLTHLIAGFAGLLIGLCLSGVFAAIRCRRCEEE